MRWLKNGFVLFVVVAIGLTLPVQAAEKTIRLASSFKAGHILVDASEKFEELLEQASAGKIAVEVEPGVGSEEDVNTWCSAGKVEMQATSGQPLQVSAPQYFFFNAPYVMKDFEHFMRVWNGALGAKAREQVEQNGKMRYLGIVYRGLRQMTSQKPIYTPEDVAGLKLRLPAIPTLMTIWKKMGVEPVPVQLPELYAALKDGKAEASEGDLSQITSFKLNEVQTHLTLTNHQVQTGAFLINQPFFDGLPKAEQDLILKAAQAASDWANAKIKKGETQLFVELQKKGMQVVIPDADAFRAKGKPAIEELFQKEWPVTTWADVLAQ